MVDDPRIKTLGIKLDEYKAHALSLVKEWELAHVSDMIDKSLNPGESHKALGEIMKELGKTENRVYDLSILRMEARTVLNSLPAAQRTSELGDKARQLLDTAGSCHGIAKSRYDHLMQMLQGVRSINSNFRGLRNAHASLGDPRRKV